MANPMKGEAKLGEHTITMNFGVFCSLEDEMSMSSDEILDVITKGMSFKQLRTVIRAALAPRHGEVSNEDVETLIDAAGGYKPTYIALGKAIRSYAGEPEAKDENPPIAA